MVGPSGSGKSTLAMHLNGLLKPDSGSLQIDGANLDWSPRELRDLRRRVGLVFQFPEAQIFEATVSNEVAFAAHQWGIASAEIPDRVRTALELVGLAPELYWNRNPLRLSGGEARLVSIASLLVVDPDWLILDEPTLGLDFAHWQRIRKVIENRSKASRAVLLITHDLTLIVQVCPRILVLNRGRLCYDGPALDLLINRDLCEDYGLHQPQLLEIWKLLRSHAEHSLNSSNFPDPDASEIESWIASRSTSEKEQICSMLLHYLSDSMP